MSPGYEKLYNVYLNPGQLHFAEAPSLVTTVLGSCISVTMFAPCIRIGAICHALLPRHNAETPCGHSFEEFRYVDRSIHFMLRRFALLAVGPDQLEVKMFGGSEILTGGGLGGMSIGKKNREAAEELIESYGLHLIAADVGGNLGRKLLFYSHKGEILLKRLANLKHY